MSKLKELLGAELFAQVATALGDGREVAIVAGDGADGSWIPKAKFDEQRTELTSLRTQLAERDTQLAELRTAAAGNETLMNRITELETANADAATKHAAALREARLDAATELAIVKAGARDARTVRPLLDMDKVTVAEDGTVHGLAEQVKALAEADATKFLFDAPADPKLVGERSAELGGSPSGKNPWKSGEVNLTEQSRIYRETPELATKLMAEAGVSAPVTT